MKTYDTTITLNSIQYRYINDSKGYYISNDGTIIRVTDDNDIVFKAPCLTNNGHQQISLSLLDKTAKTFLVHRLVYSTWVGEIPKGMAIHHLNEIKTDNRVDNLEMMGRGEHNSLHSHAHSPAQYPHYFVYDNETKTVSYFYKRQCVANNYNIDSNNVGSYFSYEYDKKNMLSSKRFHYFRFSREEYDNIISEDILDDMMDKFADICIRGRRNEYDLYFKIVQRIISKLDNIILNQTPNLIF